MQIDKSIQKLKEALIWTFIAAVIAGIIYAICTHQATQTPGEIIYENTHTRFVTEQI